MCKVALKNFTSILVSQINFTVSLFTVDASWVTTDWSRDPRFSKPRQASSKLQGNTQIDFILIKL